MGFRRLYRMSLSCINRTVLSIFRHRHFRLISGVALFIYVIIVLVSQIIITYDNITEFDSPLKVYLKEQKAVRERQRQNAVTNVKKHQEDAEIPSNSGKVLEAIEHRSSADKKESVHVDSPKRPPSPFVNITSLTQATDQSDEDKQRQKRLRYSFVDVEHLEVDIDYLDEKYQPPENFDIELPSPDEHPFSRLLQVKGETSVIIYNRVPQCYEFTMNALLSNVSFLNSFKYLPSKIYTPFSYNDSALLSIAKSVADNKYTRLFYERHIYFFDFYKLQIPKHPIWINLVRDPIHRVAADYNRSREVCRNTDRCFVQADEINETLDECALKRSPKHCISPMNGVSRMLPFFCGLTHPFQCQDENDWAVQQAKQNIDFFYTVIGIAEEFYKFLYVLEKLLPDYFKLSRLVYMNQQDPNSLADSRDIDFILPNETTIQILRPFLKYEYDIYEYIKQRFNNQFTILLDLDK